MIASVLSAQAVTRTFRDGSGVFDIDLDLHPGQITALVGLNGAGKSTLMRLLLGMLRPHAGRVMLAGEAMDRSPSSAWARVGHLVEYPLAYAELSVRRNLQLSARMRRVAHIDAAVAATVAEFALEPYIDRRVRALSLGNRQRVGLAAALQHDPDIIVLDEPTNALDPAGVIRLRESLLRRAGDGAAILVSSHHLDEVARIADRIAVINAGRLISDLDPATHEIERAFFEVVRLDDAMGRK
ncbi:ABC transporter ATP-binding protein [uncultured Microbacterium sp.]|uniref:ABC transporter ATP-binding protein n=1 Tax=uncultured Microbacterium sp. TaxID=191216 RepID=UPI0028D3093C|nr:ABC transporter ATP-binding protein [uncultured Microbacterium sp.]